MVRLLIENVRNGGMGGPGSNLLLFFVYGNADRTKDTNRSNNKHIAAQEQKENLLNLYHGQF